MRNKKKEQHDKFEYEIVVIVDEWMNEQNRT